MNLSYFITKISYSQVSYFWVFHFDVVTFRMQKLQIDASLLRKNKRQDLHIMYLLVEL